MARQPEAWRARGDNSAQRDGSARHASQAIEVAELGSDCIAAEVRPSRGALATPAAASRPARTAAAVRRRRRLVAAARCPAQRSASRSAPPSAARATTPSCSGRRCGSPSAGAVADEVEEEAREKADPRERDEHELHQVDALGRRRGCACWRRRAGAGAGSCRAAVLLRRYVALVPARSRAAGSSLRCAASAGAAGERRARRCLRHDRRHRWRARGGRRAPQRFGQPRGGLRHRRRCRFRIRILIRLCCGRARRRGLALPAFRREIPALAPQVAIRAVVPVTACRCRRLRRGVAALRREPCRRRRIERECAQATWRAWRSRRKAAARRDMNPSITFTIQRPPCPQSRGSAGRIEIRWQFVANATIRAQNCARSP